MAEQGASTSTPSKLPDLPGTCLPSQGLVEMLRKGLRRPPAHGLFQLALDHVGRDDEPLAPHQRGEVQGLAPRACAGVPPAFPGIGVASQADRLRGEVLNLQLAPDEGGQMIDVDVGVELGRSGERPMDPGPDAESLQLVPGLLRVGPLRPHPQGGPRLQGAQEVGEPRLGRGVARREGEMLAEPGGEQTPGVGRQGLPVEQSAQPLGLGRPGRRVSQGEQSIRIAPDRLRPDAAGRVDAGGIEQRREQDARIAPVQVEGVDPPSPAEQGERRLADEAMVGRRQISSLAEGRGPTSDRPASRPARRRAPRPGRSPGRIRPVHPGARRAWRTGSAPPASGSKEGAAHRRAAPLPGARGDPIVRAVECGQSGGGVASSFAFRVSEAAVNRES